MALELTSADVKILKFPMCVKSGVMSRTGGSATGGSARAEGVHERRECMSGGSVQVEEGQSSRRKVQSWTWKCPKPLVDLTEEAEQEQEQN